MFSDVELDGHLSGITQKRVDAVLNKKMRYVGPDGKKVDEMDAVINSSVFRDIVSLIIKRKLWGRVGMEFIPGDKLCMVEIPVKHIKPYIKKITKEQSGEDGWDYEGMQNIWVMHKPGDLGLLLKCAYYVLIKRGVIGDWAEYVEIFGQPVRIAKYDAYDIKTKQELTIALEEAGSSLALMIPKQVDFEMMDGKQTNANGELQEKLKNTCNDEMSVIVLGNTETTTSSPSSGYAQAKEHGKQQVEVNKSDMIDVELTVSCDHFQNILRTYALPVVEGGRFEYEQEEDLDELSTRKDIDIALSAKVPIDDDYFYNTYGIPKPENYDELKAKMEEENQMKLNPPAPGAPAAAPAKKEKKKPKNLSAPPEGFWNWLTGFFAHGQED
jgi:phage gp29-like protein